MARQDYDPKRRRFNARGWRAMFLLSGFEHSLTADAGDAWAPSPWGGGTARSRARTKQARSTGAGIDGLDYD